MPLHNKLFKIGHCYSGALESQLLGQMQPSQHLNDFDIDELWPVESLGRIQDSRSNAVGLGRPQYQLHSRRRVQDDQRESRSARNTSVGDSFPV